MRTPFVLQTIMDPCKIGKRRNLLTKLLQMDGSSSADTSDKVLGLKSRKQFDFKNKRASSSDNVSELIRVRFCNSRQSINVACGR